MSDLMDCPFCGAIADESGEHHHEEDCFFSAYDRLLSAKNSDLSGVPAVLLGWNKRAIPADQVLVSRELLERVAAYTETLYDREQRAKALEELRTFLHP